MVAQETYYRWWLRAMTGALQHAKVLAPRTDGLAVLVR
jgi:hypothetical protein